MEICFSFRMTIISAFSFFYSPQPTEFHSVQEITIFKYPIKIFNSYSLSHFHHLRISKWLVRDIIKITLNAKATVHTIPDPKVSDPKHSMQTA